MGEPNNTESTTGVHALLTALAAQLEKLGAADSSVPIQIDSKDPAARRVEAQLQNVQARLRNAEAQQREIDGRQQIAQLASEETKRGLEQATSVLTAIRAGNLKARVTGAVLESKDPGLARLGRELNSTATHLESVGAKSMVDEYHESTMELALGLSEAFEVLAAVRAGNYEARVSKETIESKDDLVAQLGQQINATAADMKEKITLAQRVDAYHESTMELALGLSEAFEVLAAVRAGNYSARVSKEMLSTKDELIAHLGEEVNATAAAASELAQRMSEAFEVLAAMRSGNFGARVSDDMLRSSDEQVARLGQTINATAADLEEKMETIHRQQVAIRELSTPVLRLWDDILALPVVGVVDSMRTADIMERLLEHIVQTQSRCVIIDITGVDVVDTRTADNFFKVVKAAELIGTRCVLTGISPAVAQTLVDIGVDLGTVVTLRNLQDGLRDCIRYLEAQRSAAQGLGFKGKTQKRTS